MQGIFGSYVPYKFFFFLVLQQFFFCFFWGFFSFCVFLDFFNFCAILVGKHVPNNTKKSIQLLTILSLITHYICNQYLVIHDVIAYLFNAYLSISLCTLVLYFNYSLIFFQNTNFCCNTAILSIFDVYFGFITSFWLIIFANKYNITLAKIIIKKKRILYHFFGKLLTEFLQKSAISLNKYQHNIINSD